MTREEIPVNKEVLAWARKRAGVSLGEATEKFSRIEAWEAETRFPNVSPARTPSRARSSIKTCLRADERPEFLRQSELIANIWTGLGAATKCVCAPGRHHYDVIADLSVPESPLTAAFAP